MANQLNTLRQNTERKEKQLKGLQMSAKEQINLEVKNTAKPVVVELAKENVLSLSREIWPCFIKRDSISLEAASHEPFDIYDYESIIRQKYH